MVLSIRKLDMHDSLLGVNLRSETGGNFIVKMLIR